MRILTKGYKIPCTLHDPFTVIPQETLVGYNSDAIINNQNKKLKSILLSNLKWQPPR